jgi:hypothetical protein
VPFTHKVRFTSSQLDFYLVFGFHQLIKVSDNGQDNIQLQFEQFLHNDYILLQDKLFIFGLKQAILMMTCVDVTSMEIILEESIYNIEESLFEIGLKDDSISNLEIDLFSNG